MNPIFPLTLLYSATKNQVSIAHLNRHREGASTSLLGPARLLAHNNLVHTKHGDDCICSHRECILLHSKTVENTGLLRVDDAVVLDIYANVWVSTGVGAVQGR